METYDRGIRSLDAVVPIRSAICRTMGIIMTTTGVLFMKADATTTIRAIADSINTGRFAEWMLIASEREESAPVLSNAPESTNIAAIVQGAGFEKTVVMALSNGNMPTARTIDAPHSATTSVGSVPLMNMANMPATTAMTAMA